MTQQVLHLDFISLKPQSGPDARKQLEDAAGALTGLDQVRAAGVIEAEPSADFDLVFYFLLSSFEALEPFGTDARYVAFLQKSVAPVLKAFAGADVSLEDAFQAPQGDAACLALMAPEETYDFEVRDALAAWIEATGATTSAVGLAVGERQRYRGAALAFGGNALRVERPRAGSFSATLVRGEARTLG